MRWFSESFHINRFIIRCRDSHYAYLPYYNICANTNEPHNSICPKPPFYAAAYTYPYAQSVCDVHHFYGKHNRELCSTWCNFSLRYIVYVYACAAWICNNNACDQCFKKGIHVVPLRCTYTWCGGRLNWPSELLLHERNNTVSRVELLRQIYRIDRSLNVCCVDFLIYRGSRIVQQWETKSYVPRGKRVNWLPTGCSWLCECYFWWPNLSDIRAK